MRTLPRPREKPRRCLQGVHPVQGHTLLRTGLSDAQAGHKQFLVTPEERAPQPASTTRMQPPEEDVLRPVECAVCLDGTLPCTHTFHAACAEGMRKFGIQQVCPMCRVELPPGPGQLNDEVVRRHLDVKRHVDRGEALWAALTKAQ